MSKKIYFFGQYLEVLRQFVLAGFEVKVIVERKKNNEEIKSFTSQNKIYTREIDKLDDLVGYIEPKSIGVVASFGLIFKENLISEFCLLFNFHPGDIFLNRGRHPLPNAIKNSFDMMSMTVHEIINNEIDAGPIIAKVDYVIDYKVDYNSNYKRLLNCLPFLSNYLIDLIKSENIISCHLRNKGKYFKKLNSEDLNEIIYSKNLVLWKDKKCR